jgi:hypothetical protein
LPKSLLTEDGIIPLVFKDMKTDALLQETKLFMSPVHVKEFCKELRNLAPEGFEEIKVYGDYENKPPIFSLTYFVEPLEYDFFTYVPNKIEWINSRTGGKAPSLSKLVRTHG